MMSSPRFTFCIPNLNKIEYLPACIESMLAQDCPDWKCVFVDGYSTDGSWEYIQQFADDSRFLLLRGCKQGMYADWNECLKYVDTEYFYFLTSDDTCYPKLVSTTTKALDAYPDIEVCHFKFALIDKQGEPVRLPKGGTYQQKVDFYAEVNQHMHRRSGICEFMMHFVYGAMYTTITSLVFRSTLIEKMQGFKSIYGSVGDFDWTMRLCLLTDILYLPELLATWRIYDEQATKQSSLVQYQERLLAVVKDNFDYFSTIQESYHLKKPVDKKQLLSSFLDGHASSLYKQILSSRDISVIFNNLSLLLFNYPLFIPRKIINRLTLNKFYSYPPRTVLSWQLIQHYGLTWPPELTTTCH
ncbi:MAG: glycosyltransferase family 2 protein [Symploca sp. SIO3E6]|nr:glycosyltransferase family 2 protein [Caldora sp. SIO3E6]